ncbi:hypothetical protein CTAYLR_008841 [Chrysophaeum taylorii]|uniref:Glycosyl transferase family 1 domain-containing protein n=1 Tax=Chrysophaeum taylorii TaxID=2483200 RepID=A0AAD7U7L1_9STRA|nr:hypothetical protein CTAYLR_008841 [Chrysophaeum taylorii]
MIVFLAVAAALCGAKTWQRAIVRKSGETLVAMPAVEGRVCVAHRESSKDVACYDPQPEPWGVAVPGACNGSKSLVLVHAKIETVDLACSYDDDVLVVWPPVGYVGAEARLEISFLSFGRELTVELGTKQPPRTLPGDMVSIVLDNLEPATHVLRFGGVEVSFDTVVDDAPRRKFYPQTETEWPRLSSAPARIVFVGSMKLDGQKTIWLEQLRRLPHNFTFVTFLEEEEDQNSNLKEILRSLGVPLIAAPIPSIAEEETFQKPLGGQALAYDGSQASVDAYLLQRLRAADGNFAACEPPWVRRTWLHLARTFRSLDPDIVVFANARDSSDAILTEAAKPAKLVMELPNLEPRVSVDVMVAPSRYAADSVVGPTVVIPPGVDAAVFRPNKDIHFFETIGFVARVAPEKSPGLFVHAMALLARRPLARFVVVGAGEALESTRRLADLYGINIDFVGAVPRGEKLAARYASFDVIVNPSLRAWSETFCIANLEALSAGVPLVTFGVGGIGEYLVPDETGVVVSDPTPQAIADAVAALLDDPSRRATLAANARAAVLRRFRVEDQMLKYETLYAALLASSDDQDTLPYRHTTPMLYV